MILASLQGAEITQKKDRKHRGAESKAFHERSPLKSEDVRDTNRKAATGEGIVAASNDKTEEK